MLRSVGISGGSVAPAPPLWTNPPPPPAPQSIQNVFTLPPAFEGQPYAYTFAATGVTQYVVVNRTAPVPLGLPFAIVDRPELAQPLGEVFPVGLNFEPNTGVMSGIALTRIPPGGNPVATRTTFWIGAIRIDAPSGRIVASSLRPFALTVQPTSGFDRTRPTWVTAQAPAHLGTYTEGQPLSVNIEATDPSSPVTYRLMAPFGASGNTGPGGQPVAGTVGGLTLSSSGVISGTPEVTHNVAVTALVRAVNNRGLYTDRNVSIFVNNIRRAPTWLTPEGVLGTVRRGSNVPFRNYTVVGSPVVRSLGELEARPDFQGFAVNYRIISGRLPTGMLGILREFVGVTNTNPLTRAAITVAETRSFFALSGLVNPRTPVGTYTFTVRCEYRINSAQEFADRTFSIVVT